MQYTMAARVMTDIPGIYFEKNEAKQCSLTDAMSNSAILCKLSTIRSATTVICEKMYGERFDFEL